MKSTLGIAVLLLSLAAETAPVGAQQMSPQERVVALKAALAASQVALQQYEWIETTAVSLKGAEKSRQEKRCYHGADGKVQKVPVNATPPPEPKRGVRGRIVEAKKEELTDYMQQAVALVHQYLPPDPARIEASKAAGKLSLVPMGARVTLVFADYLKAGDRLSVEVDAANNRLLGIQIASFIDSPDDAVALGVGLGALVDGTTYTARTQLDAAAKGVSVVVENSGYRKAQ